MVAKAEDNMQFRVVLLEQTNEWNDDIKQRAGRIFAAYLLDAGRETNCAELTPSYDLTYLYRTSTKGHDDEDLQATLIAEPDGEGGKYVHCKVIDNLPESRVYKWNGLPFERAGTEDETYEKLFEDCVDYFRGNVKIDLPIGEPGMLDGAVEPASPSEGPLRPRRARSAHP
jgi:hypothetical protein